MCELCDRVKNSAEYGRMIAAMTEEDEKRIGNSGLLAGKIPLVSRNIYSSMKYPVKLIHPMFEARAAFAVPKNYYQPAYLNGEKLGINFTHGCMRSLFFSGDRLVLFSKTAQHSELKDYFISFLLVHFEKGEYKAEVKGGNISIRADATKALKNLVTGKVEKKKISFNFINRPVIGRIMGREQVLQSTRYKQTYSRYAGGARAQAASIDIYGYAVSVPHFSPHPYLVQIREELGYSEKQDLQEHVIDYFRGHISG